MDTCVICVDTRLVNCYGIRCCLQCKKKIATRPKDVSLLQYIDDFHNFKGLGNDIHQKLYRFWYDSEGKKEERSRILDTSRRKLSLVDICCDQIVKDKSLILEMTVILPDCAPPWANLLKAWGRMKHLKIKKPAKNAFQRILTLANSKS